MRPTTRNLAVTAAGTLVAMGAALLDPRAMPAAAWAALVWPLAFGYPGYAILIACGLERDTTLAERGTVVLGASLGCVVVSALALHVTPWGLRGLPWVTLLGTLTLAFCAAAAFRRAVAAPPVEPTGQTTDRSPARHGRSPWTRTLAARFACYALSAALAAGGLVIAVIGDARAFRPQYTQLWIAPGNATGQVEVAVRNLEGEPTSYDLAIRVDGSDRRTWAKVSIPDGATWHTVVTVPWPGRRVDAVLTRTDNRASPYRSATLWLR